MLKRLALVLIAVAYAIDPAAAWEYVVDGNEVSAVLLADRGDVVSAGIIGDPFVGAWQMAVTRHAASDGTDMWRYVIANTGPLYQWGAFLARAPGGAFVVATHQRERYQEFTGSVVKLSADGAVIWRNDPRDFIGFYAIAVDPSGDVVVAGAISQANPTDHDLVVLKLSGQTGVEQWRRVFAGVEDSVFDRFSSVAVDSVGDVFAGGELFADATLGFPDFFVVKLDGASGTEAWRKFIPSLAGHGGHATALAVDSNDDLVAAGWAVLVAWCDFTVAKFEGESGTELWRAALDESGNCDDAQAVAIDGAGDVVATGDIGNKFATAKFAGSTGTLLWRYDVPHLSTCSGGGCASGRSVRIDSTGRVLIAGNARGPATSEMTAALLDRDSGLPIWLRRIDFEQCDDLGYAADINASGDIAIGGIAYSQTGGACTWPAGGKFALVKIFGDSDGDTVTNDIDNCLLEPNPGQIDSDLDGFGNACDADYDNSGIVGVSDFGIFRLSFGSDSTNAQTAPMDHDGDGRVGMSDFGFFRRFFGGAPGPSALACAGIIPCSQ